MNKRSGLVNNKVSYSLLAVYALLLLIMPYYYGLFFDRDMYIFELVIIGLFSLGTILFTRCQLESTFQSIIIYPLIFLIGIYFFSAYQGYAPLLAFQGAFRMLTYGIIFIGLLVLLDRKLNRLLFHIISLSIAWVTIFGLLAHFGLVDFEDAILHNRISSVLQYPNTLAALVGAFIISGLMLAVSKQYRWYIKLPYLILLIPSIVVFIYTQSRATWLIFPFIWFIGLFFLNVKQQIGYVVGTVLLGGGLILLLPSYETFVAVQNTKMIYILFGSGIVYTGLFLFLWLLFSRINNNLRSDFWRLALPLFIILIGILVYILLQTEIFVEKLPDTIKQRIDTIDLQQSSVTTRGAFFRDSFELFTLNWLIGTGGNGWKALFLTIQSLPYYSTQTHSFPIGILVETGLLGSIAFLGFIGIILLTTFRWLRKNGLQSERLIDLGIPSIMALMIFVHSIVDFDMSYGYVAILWFSLLAIIYVEVRDEQTEYKINKTLLTKSIMWGTTAVVFIALIFIGRFAYAETIKVDNRPVIEALSNIDKKISLNPINSEYRFIKMEILESFFYHTQDPIHIQAAVQESLKIIEIDNHQPESYLRVANFIAKYGYALDAIKYTEKALELAPWYLSAYEQYIAFGSQMAQNYLHQGEKETANTFINNVIFQLTILSEKREYLVETELASIYWEYRYTDSIRRFGGQVLVIYGDYDQAIDFMAPLLNNQDPITKLDGFLWSSVAEELRGNQEKAVQLIEQGRTLDPDFDSRRDDILYLINKYNSNNSN